MRGELLDDPQTVAPLHARAIDHFGVKRAQRMLGLKIHTPATPATEALTEAAGRYHLSAIRLTVKPDPGRHATARHGTPSSMVISPGAAGEGRPPDHGNTEGLRVQPRSGHRR